MEQPLAIDLCCGLFQAEFGRGADAAVEQLVASRAQDPKHLAQGVRDYAPGAIPLELRTVGNFKDSSLSARLAGGRQIGILPPQPPQYGIFKRTARIVDFLEMRLAAVKRSTLLPRRFSGANIRAVAAVCIRRRYVEMRAASQAIAACLRHIGLFAAPSAPGSRLAGGGAIQLVWPLSRELLTAICAKQFVHHGTIA